MITHQISTNCRWFLIYLSASGLQFNTLAGLLFKCLFNFVMLCLFFIHNNRENSFNLPVSFLQSVKLVGFVGPDFYLKINIWILFHLRNKLRWKGTSCVVGTSSKVFHDVLSNALRCYSCLKELILFTFMLKTITRTQSQHSNNNCSSLLIGAVLSKMRFMKDKIK